ncbi:hypothetical protein V8F33_004824 [Rhypophila sp. PSN 637]
MGANLNKPSRTTAATSGLDMSINGKALGRFNLMGVMGLQAAGGRATGNKLEGKVKENMVPSTRLIIPFISQLIPSLFCSAHFHGGSLTSEQVHEIMEEALEKDRRDTINQVINLDRNRALQDRVEELSGKATDYTELLPKGEESQKTIQILENRVKQVAILKLQRAEQQSFSLKRQEARGKTHNAMRTALKSLEERHNREREEWVIEIAELRSFIGLYKTDINELSGRVRQLENEKTGQQHEMSA